MTSLAHLLEHGIGKQKDEALAVQWYRLAAEVGYARAMNCLGVCYFRGTGVDKDYGEAVQWYRKAAELGNPNAQNNLGICFEEGKGVVRDLILAKTWYKAASDAHHASGTNNLGFMLLVEENYVEALKLFYLAWALGSGDAAFNIGTLYESGCKDAEGVFVERNIDMAIRWYEDAAEKVCFTSFNGEVDLRLLKDSTKAQLRLATLLTTLPHPQPQHIYLAVTQLNKACEAGNADAFNLLGKLQQLGIGTENHEPDLVSAYENFCRGAIQGNMHCLYNLALCFEGGLGISKDQDKAMMLMEEAARLGHREAIQRVELRECLVSGNARPHNLENGNGLSTSASKIEDS
ncbi:hypothetical protein HDU84_005869 [Entophlyctis sp. JEL0112]|nr:hypothetical protein HDU84_005869 [Entophlyctis sp. JEL0112]